MITEIITGQIPAMQEEIEKLKQENERIRKENDQLKSDMVEMLLATHKNNTNNDKLP
jgi:cell division protein FtsB